MVFFLNTKEIITKVECAAQEIADKNGFELVDVEFVKEVRDYYLRVYFDKDGGFSIDDCTLASRTIEKYIDAEDFIEQAYILEVSSPGLDRALKKDREFTKYKGRTVDLKLFKPLDGEKNFHGELLGLENGCIVISCEDKEYRFEKKNVAICRLSVEL